MLLTEKERGRLAPFYSLWHLIVFQLLLLVLKEGGVVLNHLHQMAHVQTVLVPQDAIILTISFHFKFKRSFREECQEAMVMTSSISEKNYLTSGQCYLSNIFLVASPIIFLLCSNPVIVDLTLQNTLPAMLSKQHLSCCPSYQFVAVILPSRSCCIILH